MLLSIQHAVLYFLLLRLKFGGILQSFRTGFVMIVFLLCFVLDTSLQFLLHTKSFKKAKRSILKVEVQSLT